MTDWSRKAGIDDIPLEYLEFYTGGKRYWLAEDYYAPEPERYEDDMAGMEDKFSTKVCPHCHYDLSYTVKALRFQCPSCHKSIWRLRYIFLDEYYYSSDVLFKKILILMICFLGIVLGVFVLHDWLKII